MALAFCGLSFCLVVSVGFADVFGAGHVDNSTERLFR